MTSRPAILKNGPAVYHHVADIARCTPVAHVLLHGDLPAWLLTRPEDVIAAARDPRFTSDDRTLGSSGRSSVKFGFMSMDGPEHVRLRRMVTSVFTPRHVAELRPYIERVVNELIDVIVPAGRADLVADLALVLPMRVICELLGVPFDEREQFEDTANAMLRPAVGGGAHPRAARANLYGYLTDLVGRKRQRPGEDLLSKLAASPNLTKQEVVETCALLLVAGYETTTDLIGTSILALITHQEQLRLVRSGATLPNAVDELIRYCGPVAVGVTRYTSQTVTVAGTSIPPGARVILGLGAANRDATRFPFPRRLDVTRVSTSHFGFGQGPHYCLGAPLARLETEVALSAVLNRLDDLALGGTPSWSSSIFHGLSRLPVVFRSSAGRAAVR
ncbi:cytochrome P450 [Streptomyces hokutonensis]|uniref:cytochrome P450 family protein n=1 Tax=Streptomyces hokutonensis TaxID=1306990 RepID=UPI0038145D84